MLNNTYSLRPHCVSCWTAYILQDDTRSLQCQDSGHIFEKYSNIIFHKIGSLVAELFHMDGRTDMAKLKVAFRNFANATKDRSC